MSDDTKEIKQKLTKTQKAFKEIKGRGEGISISAAVLGSWVLQSQLGVEVPPEIVATAASFLGTIGARLQNSKD